MDKWILHFLIMWEQILKSVLKSNTEILSPNSKNDLFQFFSTDYTDNIWPLEQTIQHVLG